MTLDTCTSEQTQFVMKVLNSTLDVANIEQDRYTRLFNELASLLFSDDVHTVLYDEITDSFYATYF